MDIVDIGHRRHSTVDSVIDDSVHLSSHGVPGEDLESKDRENRMFITTVAVTDTKSPLPRRTALMTAHASITQTLPRLEYNVILVGDKVPTHGESARVPVTSS